MIGIFGAGRWRPETVICSGPNFFDVRKPPILVARKEQLSEMMDINAKYLSSIERGKENPTLDTLIRLAQSLEVDLGQIFSFVQIEDPSQRRSLLMSLIKKADNDQLKLALKILLSIMNWRWLQQACPVLDMGNPAASKLRDSRSRREWRSKYFFNKNFLNPGTNFTFHVSYSIWVFLSCTTLLQPLSRPPRC